MIGGYYMVQDAGRDPFRILKSTQLGSATQEQFSDIQKSTFISPDLAQKKNWNNQVTIKQAQLATKTFGYGLPDPSSFTVENTTTDTTVAALLQPAAGEVFSIDALSVMESSGASTAGAYLSIWDGSAESIIWVDTSISASQIDVICCKPLYLANNCYLRLVVISGSVKVGIAYSKIIY
jgi:hypothetical protein|tara:strand:- start:1360 stop:1896 length:537 start_codon:yes stop_codon:yes gene_type:complete